MLEFKDIIDTHNTRWRSMKMIYKDLTMLSFCNYLVRINGQVFTENNDEFKEAYKKAYMWEKLKR